jgi:proteasome lid subunit RPN8/RPN11
MDSSKDSDSKKGKPSTSGTTVAEEKKVGVGFWKSSERHIRRSFPGPREASAPLRVAVDRAAYAELIAHAKSSLEKEICGVLVGSICEDEQGIFVHVAAIVRGAAASHGSTHVTFTQETWNGIHATLERDYPKLQMVGWYHSHPGFGVEFSEMDLFIQKNFFPGSTQIALVIDPLSGAVAIIINSASGTQYLDRFWVDGREQLCQVPKSQLPKVMEGAAASPQADPEALKALESRLGQLIQIMDDQRTSYYRFLMFIGIVVCLGVVACIGYTYYSQFRYRNEPPQLNQIVPVPIQVGDKTVMVGVGVVEWHVPEELNAIMISMAKEKKLAEEKAAKEKEAAEKIATNATNKAAGTTNASSKGK